MLADEGIVIRKFFLHISREEQRRRLEERLSDPTRNWKFAPGDLAERAHWDAYTAAYEEVLVDTLERMNPQYPKASPEVLRWKGKIE